MSAMNLDHEMRLLIFTYTTATIKNMFCEEKFYGEGIPLCWSVCPNPVVLI